VVPGEPNFVAHIADQFMENLPQQNPNMLDQASNVDSAQQDMEGSVILLDQPALEDYVMNLGTEASQSMMVRPIHVG
jgi:hypothetical protein